MDEEKKKQINEAISVLREFCNSFASCYYCPLYGYNCDGDSGSFDLPCDLTDIP